jgi:hypothetical protein
LRAGRRDAFADRKGVICLSFQFIVDASYKILNISGGLRGSVSDVTVWNRSAVCKNLGTLMAKKEWLMADMGYPLRPFMMSGYRKNELQPFFEGKTYFNVLFSGTRNIVERVFGILKARFPVLHGMWYRVKTESLYHDTVSALGILHNLCIDARDQWDESKVLDAQKQNKRLRQLERRKFLKLLKAGRVAFGVHSGSLQAGRKKRHALAQFRGAAVGPAPDLDSDGSE